MRSILLVGGAALALLAAPVSAQNLPAAPPTSEVAATNATMTGQTFVNKAAIGGEYEIHAAKIAEHRSHTARIDAFAQRMIHDHGRNDAQLDAVVAKIGGLHVPLHLDRQHRGMIQQLETVSRNQFDTVYAEQQVQAHQNAVALFASYVHNGVIPRLKRFAAETLPMLHTHLALARELPGGPQVARNR
ncbi:MAG TPA: DUF4142 domain-containing protein [Rhizomicrobium sp.]|jgi:putative membrane protein|nr:DUF4142 domain-containing protein [Rhizomicrobium sp.]